MYQRCYTIPRLGFQEYVAAVLNFGVVKEEKDPAAVQLGKKRWEGVSKKKRREQGIAAASERWDNATEAEKLAVGAKLAAARAAKRAEREKATGTKKER